jgi:hypothetical protein
VSKITPGKVAATCLVVLPLAMAAIVPYFADDPMWKGVGQPGLFIIFWMFGLIWTAALIGFALLVSCIWRM